MQAHYWLWGSFLLCSAALIGACLEDDTPPASCGSGGREDGSTETITGARLHLSDSFQPLTLKQSVGVFLQPVNNDTVPVESRAVAGAQEVIASGTLALDDADGTPEVEVKELSGFSIATA